MRFEKARQLFGLDRAVDLEPEACTVEGVPGGHALRQGVHRGKDDPRPLGGLKQAPERGDAL